MDNHSIENVAAFSYGHRVFKTREQATVAAVKDIAKVDESTAEVIVRNAKYLLPLFDVLVNGEPPSAMDMDEAMASGHLPDPFPIKGGKRGHKKDPRPGHEAPRVDDADYTPLADDNDVTPTEPRDKYGDKY